MDGYWESDKLEDLVAKTLIAMYDMKHVGRTDETNPAHLMTEKEAGWVRQRGPYFPPDDRLVLETNKLDLTNDGMPDGCVIAHTEHVEGAKYAKYDPDANYDPEDHVWVDGYLTVGALRRSPHRLPGNVVRVGPGHPYENFTMIFQDAGGALMVKDWVTVDSQSGTVYPTRWFIDNYYGGRRVRMFLDEEHERKRASFSSSILWQFWSDRRHLWLVDAREHEAHATFGVYPEQIKSLLYARSLPITAAGRKRPILHWVSAHKRRIKAGIDVDVTKHLRGVSEFEMFGTSFAITQPLKNSGGREGLADVRSGCGRSVLGSGCGGVEHGGAS